MSTITFEDYKNAIKAKYEEEKNGEYSHNLNSPTAANLRNLCIKRFNANTKKEDLLMFESFFEFPFDKNKKNLFGDDELNKLESVKRFFLGKTENPAEDTIQLAAILVDLQPRPFNEYRKQLSAEEKKLIDELRDTAPPPKKEVSLDVFADKIIDNANSKNDELEQIQSPAEMAPIPIATFVAAGEPIKSRIIRYSLVAAFSAGLAIMIYLAFFQKQCMQWSGDHYEKVSCDLEVKGLGSFNVVEPFDKTVFDLKKIKVCDTTAFFNKNGDAIVWYGKTANGIDFFNGHGRHPESNSPLKPVTRYILNKYVKK
ncbi:hypothetical protein N4T20_20590 [Flavobacterium sp. TR2]|uniref:hypothetical protein n=1 Tax=Flavobacterium sp. TR2 TaxID=2977321 RepID=UPI0021B11728|nr:hypothetical protein [Flavobacterium sp. TR2]UWY28107.1 hypothetical protein N4T20_20590 [Flavobacterium sp. TR2]